MEKWIFDRDFTVTLDMISNDSLIKSMIPNIINGTFNCSSLGLTSLDNCPQEVNSNFICSHNKLTSLKYCPEKIKYHFVVKITY